MKKKTKIIVCVLMGIIAGIVIGLAVLYIHNLMVIKAKQLLKDSIEEKLSEDFFDSHDDLAQKVNKYISYSIKEVRNESFDIEVEYVDICEELLVYMDMTDTCSEEIFSDEVGELLAHGDKKSELFTIDYVNTDEVISIVYADEVKDAFSCGLLSFCDEYFEAYEDYDEDDIYKNLNNISEYFEIKKLNDAPEFTEDILLELTRAMPFWILAQEESVESLDLEEKIEIAMIGAHYDYLGDYYITCEHFAVEGFLMTYFCTVPDWNDVHDTDLLIIHEGSVELVPVWGDLESEVVSIEKIDEVTYSAVIQYYRNGYFGKKYTHATVTYDIGLSADLENWYYINDLCLTLEMSFMELYELNDYNIEQVRQQIVAHYTDLWQSPGTYVSFDRDDKNQDNVYTFVLRYQMSDEEVEERFAEGKTVAANIYTEAIYVDLQTGEVTDEYGRYDSWVIDFSSLK